MPRKKIERVVLMAVRKDGYYFDLYKLEGNKYNHVNTLGYFLWDIDYLYSQIRNTNMFDEKAKIQFIMQENRTQFVVRSCNRDKVYTVNIGSKEIDCSCDWSMIFVKTGKTEKLCKHVTHVKLFCMPNEVNI